MIDKLLRRFRPDMAGPRHDRQSPVGPWIAHSHRLDFHGLRTAPRGNIRNHGHANTGLDDAADRIKGLDPDTQVQPPAKSRRVSREMILQRRSLREADKRPVGHLGKADQPAPRELIGAGADQHQPVVTKWKTIQPFAHDAVDSDTDIAGAGSKRERNIGAFALLDINTDRRMPRQKRCKHARQMLARGRRVGEKADMSPHAVGI